MILLKIAGMAGSKHRMVTSSKPCGRVITGIVESGRRYLAPLRNWELPRERCGEYGLGLLEAGQRFNANVPFQLSVSRGEILVRDPRGERAGGSGTIKRDLVGQV